MCPKIGVMPMSVAFDINAFTLLTIRKTSTERYNMKCDCKVKGDWRVFERLPQNLLPMHQSQLNF